MAILFAHCTRLEQPDPNHAVFRYGAIGVDFFFLVSGYLLAKKVASETRRNDDRTLFRATRDFILGKIRAVFPYLLFSGILILAVCYVSYDHLAFLRVLKNFLYEMSFLTVLINNDLTIIGGVWYLSAMILAMLLVYPLQKKYGKTFSWIISPLIFVFLGGYLFQYYADTSMRSWSLSLGIAVLGLAKAIMEISLGCTVYELTEAFRTIRWNRFGKLLLSLAELLTVGFVWFANGFLKEDVRPYDPLFILLLCAGIMIAFSEQTFFCKFCCNPVFYYLEKLSLPLFLNNYIFLHLCNHTEYFGALSFAVRISLTAGGALVISVLEIPFVSVAGTLLTKLFAKLKGTVTLAEEEQPTE